MNKEYGLYVFVCSYSCEKIFNTVTLDACGWDEEELELRVGENASTCSPRTPVACGLLQDRDGVTAAGPASWSTALREENLGTAEGKGEEIIMEVWGLPRRPVLEPRGQSNLRSRERVQLVTWWAERGGGGGTWKALWLEADPWIRLQKEQAEGLQGRVKRDLGYSALPLCKGSSECWERNSKSCPRHKATDYKKRLNQLSFLLPMQSLVLLGPAQKTLDGSLAGIFFPPMSVTALYLSLSVSKDILSFVSASHSLLQSIHWCQTIGIPAVQTYQLLWSGDMLLSLAGLHLSNSENCRNWQYIAHRPVVKIKLDNYISIMTSNRKPSTNMSCYF